MISKLSEAAISKLQNKLNDHQWLSFSNSDLYDKCYKRKIKPDTARLLDEAQRGFILGLDISKVAEELKPLALEIDEPVVYYQPAVAELYKLGIRFKNTDDDRVKQIEKLWNKKLI